MGSMSRAKEIFRFAVDLPKGERTRYVNEECGGDELLRQEVHQLLRFDPGKTHATDDGLSPTLAQCFVIGSRIGPYQITAILGEGGSADVSAAVRAGRGQPAGSGTEGGLSPGDRITVALKVLRRRDPSPRWRYRFEREAQILGDLAHPGIASLVDSDIMEDGRPYLAMEHIDGEPLTTYATRAGLSIRQRLELIARVVDAVDFGHRRGVVHRDLKPGNVLAR